MKRFIVLLGACISSPKTDRVSSAASCPPTGTMFANAVCVCDDLAHVGSLSVLDGPSGPGSVGVNGKTALVSAARATGSWNTQGGLEAVGAVIGGELATAGSVHLTGDARVSGDATIGGDLSCVGTVDIAGKLGLGGTLAQVGAEADGGRVPYVAPADPCNCDPSTFFDVAAAVAAAKGAAQPLPQLGVGSFDVHLTSGNYYATAAQIVGNAHFTIDGQVAVFVDGSIQSVGNTQWQLGSSSTLDLFVSGDVQAVGNVAAGSASDPAAFRLYVGGGHAIQIVGNQDLWGSLYAPAAAVQYVGNAKIVGAVFARTLEAVGNLEVDYGASLTPPPSCGGNTPVLQ